MAQRDLVLQVWFSRDDGSGCISCVVEAIQEDGQHRLLGSEQFEPWADWSDVAAWVWRRMTVDMPAQPV